VTPHASACARFSAMWRSKSCSPVGAGQELAREQVLRIDRQRLVRPHDRVFVAALIPVARRNRQVHGRRQRVVRERAPLHVEAGVEPAERLEQAAVQQIRLRPMRIDLECALQTALGAGPIPLTQEEHVGECQLRIGGLIVQREGTQGGTLRLPIRITRIGESQLRPCALRPHRSSRARRPRRIPSPPQGRVHAMPSAGRRGRGRHARRPRLAVWAAPARHWWPLPPAVTGAMKR
jgi:hypothetical protein